MNLPNGKVGLYSIVLLLIGSRAMAAQTITISGAQTSGLTVSTATAGSQPNAVTSTNGSTTYNCTTPAGGGQNPPVYRITAALTTAMPTGTTLKVKFAAPTVGGVSTGFVTLSTTPANVITGIPTGKTCGATAIQYQFSALASAGIITSPGNTRSVTFRILTP